MNWSLRAGGAGDAVACHDVYFDAVRNGTAPLYSDEEARAWAPSEDVEDWLPPRLQDGITWIAEDEGHAIGFLTVTTDGHLDLFFVRPDWRGTGLAPALYQCMRGWAVARGLTEMTTHASQFARRFLEPRGWVVLETESAVRHGVTMTRWKMGWRVA